MNSLFGFIFVLFLTFENYQVAGEKCSIQCFYFTKTDLKILKCQSADRDLPQNAIEVNCEVTSNHGKLQFLIGSREKIDKIEPQDWALSFPEKQAVVHLEFDLYIPVINSNTISKVFPNLKSLVIFKTDNIKIDAFKELKGLQEFKITRNSNVLHGKSLLLAQEYKSHGLNLRYNASCFRCDSANFTKLNFFVDFHSSISKEHLTVIKRNECPVNNSRKECHETITPEPKIMPVYYPSENSKSNKQSKTFVSTQSDHKNYTPLIFLIIMSVWIFILTVVIIIVIVALYKHIQNQKPTFVEKFTEENLITNSEDPSNEDI